MNIDPRSFTNVKDWCEATTLPLSKLLTVPTLTDPDEWAEWGYTVIQAPALAQYIPPDPRFFVDWQEWALRFNQAVPL